MFYHSDPETHPIFPKVKWGLESMPQMRPMPRPFFLPPNLVWHPAPRISGDRPPPLPDRQPMTMAWSYWGGRKQDWHCPG